MKAIILCGGKGLRIETKSVKTPKALVQVGDRPLIMYTIERYVAAGVYKFILCGGYLVRELQMYFSSISFAVQQYADSICCSVVMFGKNCTVEVVDTGLDSCKTDRIRYVMDRVTNEVFFVSYCDCVSDVDICKLFQMHIKTGAMMTLTVINPVSRYGHVICKGDMALTVEEKPIMRDIWINGGFMSISPEASVLFENGGMEHELETFIMPKLAHQNKLAVYRHTGFWKNIETQKDVLEMNNLLSKDGEQRWKEL